MFLISFSFTTNIFIFTFVAKILESQVATMYVQQEKTPDDLLRELYTPPPEEIAGDYNPGEDPCKLSNIQKLKLFIFRCVDHRSNI